MIVGTVLAAREDDLAAMAVDLHDDGGLSMRPARQGEQDGGTCTLVDRGVWLHVRSGGIYAMHGVAEQGDGEPHVLYSSIADGRRWLRVEREWQEPVDSRPRFERRD